MTNSIICYGEPFPIAMDALPVELRRHRQPQQSQTGRPDTMNRMTSRRIALDADTALEDGQWEKLAAFLRTKLSGDDLDIVEGICRRGEDAPSASGPAADAALKRRPTAEFHFPHADRLKK